MDASATSREESHLDLTTNEATTKKVNAIEVIDLEGDEPAVAYPATAYVKPDIADEVDNGQASDLHNTTKSKVFSDALVIANPDIDAKASIENEVDPETPDPSETGSKTKARIAPTANMTPPKTPPGTPQVSPDVVNSGARGEDTVNVMAGKDSSELEIASPGEMIIQDNAHVSDDQNDEAGPSTEIQPAITLDENDSQQLETDAKIANGNETSPRDSKHHEETALKMVDMNSSEDKMMRVSKHLPLNRHTYTIYGPGVAKGDKPNHAPRKLETPDDPYHAWPLYNDFKPIIKGDQSSWPPEHVNLQDWHVHKIMEAGISIKDRSLRWPADFHKTNVVHEHRKPKGRAAKIFKNGLWYYLVLPNGYQFSGDEGSQAITTIPRLVGADGKPKQGPFSLGQDCEAQEDFVPTVDELRRGILISRLPKNTDGPRPLNNRPNFGPENRAMNPRIKKGSKKTANNLEEVKATTAEEQEKSSGSQSSTDVVVRKRPAAEASTTARKATKTTSTSSPGGSSNSSAKTVKTAQTSDIKGKGKERVIEPTGGSSDYVVVKAGIFNKTPRTQNGPVLAYLNLKGSEQYFHEILHQVKADIRQACVSDNHELAVSRLMAADNLLECSIKALDIHFEKACKEVKTDGK